MYCGRRVRLRALEMDDLDAIMRHWNTLEMRQNIQIPLPMSREAERKWLERVVTEDPLKVGYLVLAIEDKGSCRFVGTTTLHGFTGPNRRAEFGIAVHSVEDQNRGYGTDATEVCLWVAFHVLGLHTVYLHALANNTRAIHVYEKVGFKMVGRFREAVFVGGQFHDLVAMDITAEEFMERYPPGISPAAHDGEMMPPTD